MNLLASEMIMVEIPDDKRDRRRDPTRVNDQRRISIKRPSPTPNTRGPSWSSSGSDDIAILKTLILLY